MKTNRKTEVVFLKGLDQKIPPGEQTAQKIINFTVDKKTGGWDSRIGYEKFQSSAGAYGPFNDDREIYSNFVWSTQNGGIQHYMYEKWSDVGGADTRDNKLCSVWGNPNVETTFRTWVGTLNRRASSEVGLQYVPYGRFLILLNGHDRPVRLDPMTGTILETGWSVRPGSPTPWGVDQDDMKPGGRVGAPMINYIGNSLYSSGAWEIDEDEYGLGYGEDDKKNLYRWKVSFISDTGSESPLSPATESVGWTTSASDGTNVPDWGGAGGAGDFADQKQAVYLGDIPRGPLGTSARRIYRTKNLGQYSGAGTDADSAVSGADEVFYLVDQVNNNSDVHYVDCVSDMSLVLLAPLESDSIVMPSPAPRVGAAYMSRLFLDGGQNDSFRVYFSNPNQPESFGALNFFDYGSTEGGAVTGLKVYNNQLLVFRENAIDVIRPQGNNVGFITVPFVQGIGTKATNTITTVPGFGVIFLAEDGVYAISGTNNGGSSLQIKLLSREIFDFVERITKSVVARSVAAFSSKWGEWHCYVPFDGKDKPSLGLVYHLEKQAWSTREGFPVSSIATDDDGNFIFGNQTGKPAGWSLGDNYEAGLFVISRKRIGGYTYSEPAGEPLATVKAPLTSTYKTAWMDFGYPNQKKFVKYVYLYVLTEGDNAIPMTYFKDYSITGTTTAGRKMQRPEHPDQTVYDSAIWGTSAWTEEMVTEIRYPIANEAASHFAFEISTNEDIVLLGYAVEYETNKTQTAKGKTS